VNNGVTSSIDWLGGEVREAITTGHMFNSTTNKWVYVTKIESWYEKNEFVNETEWRNETMIYDWYDNSYNHWGRIRSTLYNDVYYEQWKFTRIMITSNCIMEDPEIGSWGNIPEVTSQHILLDAFEHRGWEVDTNWLEFATTKTEDMIIGNVYE
jgi:hypothetical protein